MLPNDEGLYDSDQFVAGEGDTLRDTTNPDTSCTKER
jgi:hypothetical protein